MAQYVFLPEQTRMQLHGGMPQAGTAPVFVSSERASAEPASTELKVALKLTIPSVKMLEEVKETGAVWVDVPEEDEPSSNELSGGRLYPVVNYEMAASPVRIGDRNLLLNSGPAAADFFSLQLVTSDHGNPISDAIAKMRLPNWQTEISAVSDQAGIVRFGLRADRIHGAMVLVEPGFGGHWGYFDGSATHSSGDQIQIDVVDTGQNPDSLRTLLVSGVQGDGAGVTIGVVDTGVGPHRHLTNVVGDDDSTIGHGTHVAGIIAGNGGGDYAGMAPDSVIRSYRVFDDPLSGVAANFRVYRAIEQAVSDGCDIINLSLKTGILTEPVVGRAVEDASDAGVLVVAAAGNDFRNRVAFPARHPDVVAVSACGTEAGLPATAYDRWTVSPDRGNDPNVYFATFSNEGIAGTSVDIIAPGAGVISTVPGDVYAPMSGTSMACPAAVGAIARILSRETAVLNMPRDRRRRDAIWHAATANLAGLGFSSVREGRGMIP